jgi:PAS domain S-box-containing protein
MMCGNFTEVVLHSLGTKLQGGPTMSHKSNLLGFHCNLSKMRHTEARKMPADTRQADFQQEHDMPGPASTRAQAKLDQNEGELSRIVDLIPQTIVVLNPDGKAIYANRVALEYTGLSLDEVLSDGFRDRVFHPEDVQRLRETRQKGLSGTVPFENEQRALGKDSKYRWFLICYNPRLDDKGDVLRWYATGTDIDDRKRTETLHAAEKRTLEMIADGASLKEVLDQLCSSIDAQVAPSVTTVLLVDADGKYLFQGGGPRVPREWISAIIPVPVAFEAGLCGTAAFLKERVVVPDVATEPNWPNQYRDLAIRNGIRAAWSEPIVTQDKEVLGTFALYSHESRVPTEKDLALIEGAGHVAQIAIERQRSQEALRNALDRLRLLFDVQQALVANLDLASLFASLAVRLREVTGCDLIGLSLPDSTNGQLRQRMVNYREGKGVITEGSLCHSTELPRAKHFEHKSLCTWMALKVRARIRKSTIRPKANVSISSY